MSTEIVTAEMGLGFTMDQFAGTKSEGRKYQINQGEHYIILDTWQALQLVAVLVQHHNKKALEEFGKK